MVLVLAGEHMKYWEAIPDSHKPSKEIFIATGGATRYESVKNGLLFIEDGIIAGIHDAVRPFVSIETIERCYECCQKAGKWHSCYREWMTLSGRSVRQHHSENLDRSTLRRVQTPQVFRSEMIKKGLYTGQTIIHLPMMLRYLNRCLKRLHWLKEMIENIKITTPTDYKLASLLMERKE